MIEVNTEPIFLNRHLALAAPIIMTKNLFVLLVFVIGIMCGVALNQWSSSGQSATNANGGLSKDNLEGKQGVSNLPVDRLLIEHFLPDTAPYWIYCNFENWRKEKKSVEEFFQKPTISTVGQELIASLPLGSTLALGELANASTRVRLFALPPKEGNPAPVVISAWNLVSPSRAIDIPPGIDLLIDDDSESVSEAIEIGDVELYSVETSLGEFAYIENQGILWIGNNKEALEQLWRQPPPPPENGDALNPFEKMLADRSETVWACFVNVDYPGEPLPGGLGSFTAFLRSSGLNRAAALFEWGDKGGKMTVLAPSENLSPWAENWSPIKKFPFGNDDPAGLVEAAIRWPGPVAIVSATGELADASGEAVRVKAAAPKRDRKDKPLRESKKETQESGVGATGGEQPSAANKKKRSEPDPLAIEKKADTIPNPGLIFKAQMGFLSALFPAGGIIGLNVFGFYDGAPTLALAIPEFPVDQSPLKLLAAMSQVSSSTMEIALLPATRFDLGNNLSAQSSGLNDLLLTERDAVTYIFDAPEAAQNYLSNKDSVDRAKDFRSLLENVKSPAQVELVFSRDFFRFILDREKINAPQDFEYREKLTSFLDEIYEYTKPMSVSAGLDEGQWFVETYSEDKLAHWVDTGLLIWSMHRFMGKK